jgi:SAM-dependent methyltransferase
MSFEVKACPLCQGTNQDRVYMAKDRHYGIPGLYPIVRCADCSLLFLNPMYSDEELSALYPQDYYAYQDNFQSIRWKDIVKAVLRCKVGTLDPRFPAPGRMLDLGCGSGWFLCRMRDRGWETHGVEISSEAAELGRETCRLDIFAGTLRQANFPAAHFDYIRSNHSFEHISCPGETLDEIHRILKREGKVLIGVPNEESLNSRFFGQYWWYRGAPVHPFTYSVRTLSKLLNKHHFAIEKVTFNSDYSGILGSFQIWLNRGNGQKSTQGVMFNDPFLKILCHWTAKFIDLFGLGDAIEITATKLGGRFNLSRSGGQHGAIRTVKIVSKLKALLPRQFKETVGTVRRATYTEDGLVATRLTRFLYSEKFNAAYDAGKRTGSWGTTDLRWRVFVACWAAGHARSIPGDFVECGVNRGGMSRAVMEYIDFDKINKKFYLLDTYCGIPAEMTRASPDLPFEYSECYEDVKQTFAQFTNVRVIRGIVPNTLSDVDSERIAYLSIDMNCAEPEIAAAEFFWDKISAGGVIILDDYCYSEEYKLQNEAFDEFARHRNVRVLALPTGQGLLFKPQTQQY